MRKAFPCHDFITGSILSIGSYDDVIEWKHFRITVPLGAEFIGHWWIPLTKRNWTNGCANNRDTGDLRRHHTLYDVTVIQSHGLVWSCSWRGRRFLPWALLFSTSLAEINVIVSLEITDVMIFFSQNFSDELYRKTSSINHTKSQNLNVSCILLQLSSLSPLKPGVKLRIKM